MSPPGIRRSVYLTALEAELADEIHRLNACSVNFVMRVGLRALAGLPVPALTVPEREALAEIVGEQVSEGVSAA